jgi:hypothetical protein
LRGGEGVAAETGEGLEAKPIFDCQLVVFLRGMFGENEV